LTELGEMSEGFETLGTDLFDLSAELDEAIVFGVGQSFSISLLKQDVILGKEIGRKADDLKLSHILAQILFAEPKKYPQQPQ
jgi:hypothetical protein